MIKLNNKLHVQFTAFLIGFLVSFASLALLTLILNYLAVCDDFWCWTYAVFWVSAFAFASLVSVVFTFFGIVDVVDVVVKEWARGN